MNEISRSLRLEKPHKHIIMSPLVKAVIFTGSLIHSLRMSKQRKNTCHLSRGFQEGSLEEVTSLSVPGVSWVRELEREHSKHRELGRQ